MSLISSALQFLYPLRRFVGKLAGLGGGSSSSPVNTDSASIHALKIMGIHGNEIDLSLYKGRKMLLVNTASECGYTPQYAGLQKLYELYKNKLVVIGFPSNNFGAQEPGTEEEIQNFCEKKYGITFPLTKKIDVTGPGKHPVFRWLTSKELNGWNDQDPNWNFCKYLVDEQGRLTDFFSHKMDPLDEKIIAKIR